MAPRAGQLPGAIAKHSEGSSFVSYTEQRWCLCHLGVHLRLAGTPLADTQWERP